MYTQYFGPIHRSGLKDLDLPSRKLQQGGLVAFPTETVYGLGAAVLNLEAIQRLYRVKQRKANHPFPIHVSNLEQLKFVVSEIPDEIYLLAHHFLPGPLTCILKKSNSLSDIVTGGKSTVAIRISGDPIARRLVELTGCPLAVPSGNITGRPSPTKASHVLEDFNGLIEGVVDGGEVEYGMESTLLDLHNPSHPEIIRFGLISQTSIEEVLNCKVSVHPSAVSCSAYSSFEKFRPAIHLFSSWQEMEIYLKLSAKGKRMIMSSQKEEISGDFFQLNKRNLYEGLRVADREGYAEVLVLCSPDIKSDGLLLNKLKQIART